MRSFFKIFKASREHAICLSGDGWCRAAGELHWVQAEQARSSPGLMYACAIPPPTLHQQSGATERRINVHTLNMAIAMTESLETFKGMSEIVSIFVFVFYLC